MPARESEYHGSGTTVRERESEAATQEFCCGRRSHAPVRCSSEQGPRRAQLDGNARSMKNQNECGAGMCTVGRMMSRITRRHVKIEFLFFTVFPQKYLS